MSVISFLCSGVNFVSDTVKDLVSPPKKKPMED